MSSIASNAEDLILNADGGSSTVKIKINGTEKASISSAGAFTSTTIDATKLTGALPAISGAALTGVGVAGITSSATSTAITIDANKNVIFSDTSSGTRVSKSIQANTNNYMYVTGASAGMFVQGDTDGAERIVISNSSEQIRFYTENTERLDITSDGRGLSQFTAKAWINFNGTNMSTRDSHNVSSLTDNGTGLYSVNFANNLANADFCSLGNSTKSGGSATGSNSSLSYVGEGRSTNYVGMETYRSDGTTHRDSTFINVAVFGD